MKEIETFFCGWLNSLDWATKPNNNNQTNDNKHKHIIKDTCWQLCWQIFPCLVPPGPEPRSGDLLRWAARRLAPERGSINMRNRKQQQQVMLGHHQCRRWICWLCKKSWECRKMSFGGKRARSLERHWAALHCIGGERIQGGTGWVCLKSNFSSSWSFIFYTTLLYQPNT